MFNVNYPNAIFTYRFVFCFFTEMYLVKNKLTSACNDGLCVCVCVCVCLQNVQKNIQHGRVDLSTICHFSSKGTHYFAVDYNVDLVLFP